ncbi:hypothetical protein D3C85_1413270 [compost metagenome]
MGLGYQRRATWQDEVLQRPELFVPQIDRRFQPFNFCQVQCLIHRHRQFATQVEQPMLTRRQHLNDLAQSRIRDTFNRQAGQQHTHLTVQGVDLANRLDPRMILGHAAAVAQAGFAFVAGAGVNLRQAKAHGLPR